MENHQSCCGSTSSVSPLSLSSSSGSQYPCLVSYNCQSPEDIDQILFTSTKSSEFRQRQHYHTQIPELSGRVIRGCFYGCLILTKFSPPILQVCLCNPVTFKVIHLPPLELEPYHDHDHEDDDDNEQHGSDHDNDDDHDDIGCCCLSSPPDDPDCLVLLSRASKASIIFCPIRDETRSWTEMSYADQINKLYDGEDALIDMLVSCSDKVYAYIRKEKSLIHLDIIVNQAGSVLINLLPIGSLPYCQEHSVLCQMVLTGYCKELFCITMCFRSIDHLQSIRLFKLDFLTMKWEEQKSVKDRVFFVGGCTHSQSFCAAVESKSGTYIHITRDSCSLYVYNMEDKTLSLLSLDCPRLSPELRQHYFTTWVMPETESSLVDDDVEGKSKSETGEEVPKDEELIARSAVSNKVQGMMNERLVEKTTAKTDQLSLLNLPPHTIGFIAQKLSAFDYLNFRTTCEDCRLAAPVIKGSGATALSRLETSMPWLMVLDEHEGITTFTDLEFGGKYFITSTELIGHSVTFTSKYGWLLVFGGESTCPVFYNPFTRETVQLPKFDGCYCCSSNFIFSDPPTSSSCLVIAFSIHNAVYFTFPGEAEWATSPIHHDSPYRLSSQSTPIFYKDDVYILFRDGELGFFKLDQDLEGKVLIVEPRRSCTTPPSLHFLVECGGDLLSISMGEVGEWVEVFKLNQSSTPWVWERIYDIGKHMIYVCDTSCVSVVAKVRGTENRIYFPRFYGDNIVFYSLNTCKFHTLGNNGKCEEIVLDNLFHTKKQLMCSWIEPSSSA